MINQAGKSSCDGTFPVSLIYDICADCEPGARCPVDFMLLPSRSTSADLLVVLATVLALFGHATAESNLDLQALIASAESFGGPGIPVPSRNSALLRWCLANGMQVVQPMTLMSIGLYNEPAGAWLPSVLF
jgi:hypothetical protein